MKLYRSGIFIFLETNNTVIDITNAIRDSEFSLVNKKCAGVLAETLSSVSYFANHAQNILDASEDIVECL